MKKKKRSTAATRIQQYGQFAGIPIETGNGWITAGLRAQKEPWYAIRVRYRRGPWSYVTDVTGGPPHLWLTRAEAEKKRTQIQDATNNSDDDIDDDDEPDNNEPGSVTVEQAMCRNEKSFSQVVRIVVGQK